MKKLFAWIVVLALAFSLAGCGSEPAETAAPAAEPQVTEEVLPAADDGQNPVMNFVGVYHLEDSVEALVEAEGKENAKITVTAAFSPWFHTQTVMSGRFDPDTLTMTFTNAAFTEYSYAADGSVTEEKLSYTDGSGRAVFDSKSSTLTITEQFPSGDLESVYVWGPASGMKTVTDADHYKSVTAMDKSLVETVAAFNARRYYLSENWYAMADMIRYPITINGTVLYNDDDFLGYMIDKTVSESDRQAMLNEDCLDMFVNYQGICMGDGEIWLNDPNFGTDREPKLEISAVNGIVTRTDDAVEVNSERDFYDTASVIAYDEIGNVHILYEGSDGYWREEDGSTYIRLSDTEFQRRDGTNRLYTLAPSQGDVEVNSERDFYDTNSVTVYGDDGIAHKIYEGSDGFWREEDGTAYVKITDTEFQLRDGGAHFYVR